MLVNLAPFLEDSDMPEFLERFYAVTMSNSVYLAELARVQGDARPPWLQRIAVQGRLTQNQPKHAEPMLSVGRWLQMFVPEGGGITSFNRQLGEVNSYYWGFGTNYVVALFLNQEEAVACSVSPNLVEKDDRWLRETIATLRAIGTEHPKCSIADSPGLWLMPQPEWQQ